MQKHVSDPSGIVRSSGGRWKKRTFKTVRSNQCPVMTSTEMGVTEVKPRDGDMDMAPAVLDEVAIEN